MKRNRANSVETATFSKSVVYGLKDIVDAIEEEYGVFLKGEKFRG